MTVRTRLKGIATIVIAAAVLGSWWIIAASKEKAQPVKEFYLDVSEFEHEFYPGAPKVMFCLTLPLRIVGSCPRNPIWLR